MRRVALYARVSTGGQTTTNQIDALRAYALARGWKATEFIDPGVSGSKDRRPGLDAMMAAVRSRKVDVVACVKLDRLARSTVHLVTLAKELEALGVDLIVLDQSVDTTTPAGRLLFNVLAAIAEFERELIVERVRAGIRRAKSEGIHCGRPRKHDVNPEEAADLHRQGVTLSEIGRRLGNGQPIHATVIRRALGRASQALAV